MLGVGLGATLSTRMGFALGHSDDSLDFGQLESLAALMQETAPDRLQELLIGKLKSGAQLDTLVAAGALANARTFGGEDYTGYHCMMALTPALAMSKRMTGPTAALPVMKVLYRNATRMQQHGGRGKEVLHVLPEPVAASREQYREQMRAAVRAGDTVAAEVAFAGLSQGSAKDAYDDLQSILCEDIEVHRVVMAWRVWEALEVTGEAHARTLMRQTVHFCANQERERKKRGKPVPALRTLLPELLDRHELVSKAAGTRDSTDEDVLELAQVIFASDRSDAARATAAALARGMRHEDAGEALSIASNRLLLHDPGRSSDQASREKPKGSVHGASVGVHASDSARAWRNIASVSNHANAVSALIGGAYHTAGQSGYVAGKVFGYDKHADEVRGLAADELLRRTGAAIEAGDQKLACALVNEYSGPDAALLELMIEYGTRADGALHAEKYFHTICEDSAQTRPAFKKNYLLGLARVTASEHGFEAPGLEAARKQLQS